MKSKDNLQATETDLGNKQDITSSQRKTTISTKKSKKKNRKHLSAPYYLIATAIALASIFLIISTISAGSEAVTDSYDRSYSAEKDAAYNTQYEKYYKKAEEEYHVSNRVGIDIGDIREISNLEVLNVNDTEYIIYDEDDNNSGITTWLKVPGTGTYTVNLQAAEFIVDDQRNYIHVRVPAPVVTNVTVDYSNVEKLLFKDKRLNESRKVGENIARQMLADGQAKIEREFAANEHFFESAKNAATFAVQCMVQQMN